LVDDIEKIIDIMISIVKISYENNI